ncbi:hypothetical protein [Actinomadura sp. 9N215]|uniref:hypothetical protein n=1 Tax=Actinomadura sp. 9N215 TaxID=3375150 RepID=UPI00379B8D1C
MNEPVTLLLLQHLFPKWTITRDDHGHWTATTRVSSPDINGLLTRLRTADPTAAARAHHLLTERRTPTSTPS